MRVYTDNPADVVERPLVAEMQLAPEREADVRVLFKKPNEDPKILIVTDKLLTGYDAPLLYCMYLDKPLRRHTLFQAITRPNRRYTNPQTRQEKRYGLVVDYVGLGGQIAQALKASDPETGWVVWKDADRDELVLHDTVSGDEVGRLGAVDGAQPVAIDQRRVYFNDPDGAWLWEVGQGLPDPVSSEWLLDVSSAVRVSRSRRPSRAKSGTPRLASSWRSCRDSTGWVTCSTSAACVAEPASAVATK